MPFTIHELDHHVINVGDVERSAARFRTVLGIEREDFDPGHGKPMRTSIEFASRRSTCGRSTSTRHPAAMISGH